VSPTGRTRFSYEQRDLLTWINAIRVEPNAWDDFLYWASYDSCSSASFTAAELAPKKPLSHDIALEIEAGTAGPGGSDDGVERLSAAQYETGFSTTFNGWACDPNARSLILDGAYEEAGTGFDNRVVHGAAGRVGRVRHEVAGRERQPDDRLLARGRKSLVLRRATKESTGGC
jgi:hypothetical protein